MGAVEIPLCDMGSTIEGLERAGIAYEIKDVNLDTGEERIVRAFAPRSYTNEQMRVMLDSLSDARDSQGRSALDREDKIGFAAYRNARILRECCQEYLERAQALADEYGEPEIADGAPTGRVIVPYDSPRFAEFEAKMREWGEIEQEPALFRLPLEEAVGKLSGSQLLALDWMFEEE